MSGLFYWTGLVVWTLFLATLVAGFIGGMLAVMTERAERRRMLRLDTRTFSHGVDLEDIDTRILYDDEMLRREILERMGES